jgi:peptidoglycan/xylan/chitin deacetylase (PgdA/CDA1 family)
MLNFRNINVLFTILALLSVVAQILLGVPAYVYIILIAVYLLVLFYGCYYVGSNFFIRVICSAQTNEKVISLSFDDGPAAGNTLQILQILKDNNAEAAFFCIGRHVNENPQIFKQVYDEGHLIGNHTFSHHFWFDMFSSRKMLADMHMMDKEVSNIIGKTPKLFRPPYGVTNPNLRKAILRGNYIPVGWSMRSMDTVIKDEKRLLNKVIGKIKPGAVFLFHDTSDATVAVLPAVINQILAKGYTIVRLDKMLNLQAYA